MAKLVLNVIMSPSNVFHRIGRSIHDARGVIIHVIGMFHDYTKKRTYYIMVKQATYETHPHKRADKEFLVFYIQKNENLKSSLLASSYM